MFYFFFVIPYKKDKDAFLFLYDWKSYYYTLYKYILYPFVITSRIKTAKRHGALYAKRNVRPDYTTETEASDGIWTHVSSLISRLLLLAPYCCKTRCIIPSRVFHPEDWIWTNFHQVWLLWASHFYKIHLVSFSANGLIAVSILFRVYFYSFINISKK